jgi:hypothetical protein
MAETFVRDAREDEIRQAHATYKCRCDERDWDDVCDEAYLLRLLDAARAKVEELERQRDSEQIMRRNARVEADRLRSELDEARAEILSLLQEREIARREWARYFEMCKDSEHRCEELAKAKP